MGDFLEQLAEYIAIIFGLAVGAIAHFGKRISDDDELGVREVVGYAMQLGLIGLLASVSTKQLGITDNDVRALATAVLAVSASEVIQWLKKNGWQRYAFPDDKRGGGDE